MGNVWLRNSALHLMLKEANESYPLETGGVLIGYLTDSGDKVIDEALGPGPAAIHNAFSFEPDHDWQCDRLDEAFVRSNGENVYLGDWHTHPRGKAEMSRRDRKTLKNIALHPELDYLLPVMIIGAGGPDAWSWRAFNYFGRGFLGCAKVEKSVIKYFE